MTGVKLKANMLLRDFFRRTSSYQELSSLNRRLSLLLSVMVFLLMPRTALTADDSPAVRRLRQAQEWK